jgi:hypothetical protein
VGLLRVRIHAPVISDATIRRARRRRFMGVVRR